MARVMDISRSKLQELHREGLIPRPIQFGRQCVRWRASEIRDWGAAGCPPRSQWVWRPSVLMELGQAIMLRKLELKDLERRIAEANATLAKCEAKP